MAKGSVVCPSCGVEEFDASVESPALHTIREFSCNACRARFVFGRPVPMVGVELVDDPAVGMRWLRLQFQNPTTKARHVEDLDPKLAAMLALNILKVLP